MGLVGSVLKLLRVVAVAAAKEINRNPAAVAV